MDSTWLSWAWKPTLSSPKANSQLSTNKKTRAFAPGFSLFNNAVQTPTSTIACARIGTVLAFNPAMFRRLSPTM